jgi:hypothetical protein
MKKHALRIAALLATPVLALANEETGTGAVAEMNVSGKQLGMMVGGAVALGLIVWGVSKLTGGSAKSAKR